jgi:5-methylcytosine-specific restriction endonuclease McrA
MDITGLAIPLVIILGLKWIVDDLVFEKKREKRKQHYQKDVLTSDLWQRKRALVLKRDGYRCVYCGTRATQVHHKKYARVNIGREPIEWLVSVCANCHRKCHNK